MKRFHLIATNFDEMWAADIVANDEGEAKTKFSTLLPDFVIASSFTCIDVDEALSRKSSHFDDVWRRLSLNFKDGYFKHFKPEPLHF